MSAIKMTDGLDSVLVRWRSQRKLSCAAAIILTIWLIPIEIFEGGRTSEQKHPQEMGGGQGEVSIKIRGGVV